MKLPDIYFMHNVSEPRPDLIYLVDKVIPEKSVNIFYGYPGSLKSMFVLDMAMAIATGSNFLPSMPNSQPTNRGKKVIESPVLWLDYDNGIDVTFERIDAVRKTYGGDNGTPFFTMSMPDWKGNNPQSIRNMIQVISSFPLKPKVIVIDTLLRFSGVKDENSSEMDTVMKSLRMISEQLGAAVIVISHSNKTNNSGRAGNALRGHSSIEGGVDSLFLVKRDGNSDLITVEHQKARRKPLDPFCARFTYSLKPNNNDVLDVTRFYFEPPSFSTINNTSNQNQLWKNRVLKALDKFGTLVKTELRSKVGGDNNALSDLLDEMETVDLTISSTQNPKNRNSRLYSITKEGKAQIGAKP